MTDPTLGGFIRPEALSEAEQAASDAACRGFPGGEPPTYDERLERLAPVAAALPDRTVIDRLVASRFAGGRQ